MIGREGPGPERPGPDYPPEWDREPDDEEAWLQVAAEEAAAEQHRPCPLCGRVPVDGEQHRQVYAVGDTGEDADEVCVGPDRRQLDYAPIVPDPWQAQGPVPPPPF